MAHASPLSKDVAWTPVVSGLAVAGFLGGPLLDGLHSRIPLQVETTPSPLNRCVMPRPVAIGGCYSCEEVQGCLAQSSYPGARDTLSEHDV